MGGPEDGRPSQLEVLPGGKIQERPFRKKCFVADISESDEDGFNEVRKTSLLGRAVPRGSH